MWGSSPHEMSSYAGGGVCAGGKIHKGSPNSAQAKQDVGSNLPMWLPVYYLPFFGYCPQYTMVREYKRLTVSPLSVHVTPLRAHIATERMLQAMRAEILPPKRPILRTAEVRNNYGGWNGYLSTKNETRNVIQSMFFFN